MNAKTKKVVSGILVLAAGAGATVGIADAAKNKKRQKPSQAPAGERFGHERGRPPFRDGPPGATALTGADADKAKAAAVAAVPGATVRRSFRVDGSRDPQVTYVVEAAKADGGPVLVLLDADFALVRTLDPPPRRGPGRPGGPPNEAELTGADADKAKAAALDAVPGGTVWRASEEDPAEAGGAAYEVHVRKADGSEVEVLLDASFAVIKTVDWAGPRGGRPHGDHDGPGRLRRPAARRGRPAARGGLHHQLLTASGRPTRRVGRPARVRTG